MPSTTATGASVSGSKTTQTPWIRGSPPIVTSLTPRVPAPPRASPTARPRRRRSRRAAGRPPGRGRRAAPRSSASAAAAKASDAATSSAVRNGSEDAIAAEHRSCMRRRPRAPQTCVTSSATVAPMLTAASAAPVRGAKRQPHALSAASGGSAGDDVARVHPRAAAAVQRRRGEDRGQPDGQRDRGEEHRRDLDVDLVGRPRPTAARAASATAATARRTPARRTATTPTSPRRRPSAVASRRRALQVVGDVRRAGRAAVRDVVGRQPAEQPVGDRDVDDRRASARPPAR